jgi:predicted ATPase
MSQGHLLQRLKARNLLSFGPTGIDLELRPLNVLIGANGSGKSNLLEAIALLRAAPGNLAGPRRRRHPRLDLEG